MFSIVALATAAVFPTVAFAGLGKDTLFKNGLDDPLADYYRNIPKPPSSRVDMPAPDMCIQHADGHCDASAIEAVSVTFEDCDVPWTVCRCNDAQMDMDTIVDRFGSVPPGIRSYVGSLLAVNAPSCSAGSGGDFIVFNGDCGVSVFVHEASHSLDQGTSPSQPWSDALAASSCVPDDYANTSPAEDFAQVDVVYVYQQRHGAIPADPSCLQAQLDYMKNDARISLAESSDKCLPDKRPFTLDPPAPATTTAAPEPTTTSAPPPDPTTSTTVQPSPSQCPAGMRRRSENNARRHARRLPHQH